MIEPVVSQAVLDCFFQLYRALGAGFLESVYGNGMQLLLERRGIAVAREVPLAVNFDGVVLGKFRADLIVAQRVLVETKAVKRLSDADERQLHNYLKATTIEVGFLLNFGPTPQFRRRILTNDRKTLAPVITGRVGRVGRDEQLY